MSRERASPICLLVRIEDVGSFADCGRLSENGCNPFSILD
nr:MAG TPA: hypothetical protein [Inoviridae sp.]